MNFCNPPTWAVCRQFPKPLVGEIIILLHHGTNRLYILNIAYILGDDFAHTLLRFCHHQTDKDERPRNETAGYPQDSRATCWRRIE